MLYVISTEEPRVWKHKRSLEDAEDNELPKTIPTHWLTDGQEIQVEGATVKVYHHFMI